MGIEVSLYSPISKEKLIEFLKAIIIVKQAEIPPWAILTHACHETGFFKRVIGNYNYWGIKKPARWDGLTLIVHTHEFVDGKKVESLAYFADWEEVDDAIAFYLALLERLYPNALKCRPCVYCFFDGLTSGNFKWATDPLYTQKLFNLYELLRKDEETKKLIDLYV